MAYPLHCPDPALDSSQRGADLRRQLIADDIIRPASLRPALLTPIAPHGLRVLRLDGRGARAAAERIAEARERHEQREHTRPVHRPDHCHHTVRTPGRRVIGRN